MIKVPPSNVGRPLPPPPVPTVTTEKSIKHKQESDVKASDSDKQQSALSKPLAPIEAWKEGSESSMTNIFHSHFFSVCSFTIYEISEGNLPYVTLVTVFP